jgi:N-sulfoglucosamine sulfohydrolase
MANAHDAHRPFAGSPLEGREFGAGRVPAPSHRFHPDAVPVPAFLPDLRPVRGELAGYFSSLRRADDTLGAVLAALEGAGAARDTLVVALSDNGMSFPFAKTNCYEQSTRMPWVVRWPGRVAAGGVEERHFVSGVDLAPTLREAAGLPPAAGLDGRSFLALLEGRAQPGRERLVTVMHRTWGKQPFEMRCLHEGRLAYIWNAWADGVRRYVSESQRGISWRAMERAAARRPELAARLRFFLYRTPEELYDHAADPAALVNLAAAPARRDALEHLRALLLAWLEETGDALAPAFREHLARAAAGSAPARRGA